MNKLIICLCLFAFIYSVDIDAAVRHLINHAQPKSIHYCARYVHNALEAGGFHIPRQDSAYMYRTNGVLVAAGFEEMSKPSSNKKGDITVTDRNSDHPDGHMAMWSGSNWISDFVQNSEYVYSSSQPPVYYYRYGGKTDTSLFLCHSISQNGIDLIKSFEGCKLKAYKDSVGVWTIGYGTTSADESITGTSIYEGLTITQATADEWLRLSVNKKYGSKVDKFNNIYHWTQNEFDALCSFAYNIGSIDGLVRNGNREKSKLTSVMKQYVYANGSKLPGLVKRRNAEVDLFNKDGRDDDCSNITEKAKCIAAKCKWTDQKTGTCSGPKCTGTTKTDCENTIGCTFTNEIGTCAVPECIGESEYICKKTAGCTFTPVKGSCSCEYCVIWKCNCLGNKDCEEKGDMIDCVNSGCEWKNCSAINSTNICTAKNEDECLDQSDYPTICGWLTTCKRPECATKTSLAECTSAKCTWAVTGICEPSVSSNTCELEQTSGTCVESVSCTGNTQETCGTGCTWTAAATGFCSNVDAKDSSRFIKSSALILLLLSLY